MKMYFILAVLCLSHLCGAQPSTKPIGMPEAVGNSKINLKDTIGASQATEDSPLYLWEEVIYPASSLPANAVVGGIDYPSLGGKVYLGRAYYNGSLLPAKIRGFDGLAFVSYNDTEQWVEKSEVLCTKNAVWKPVTGLEIPTNAFPVGFTDSGEILYMGRWFANLLLTPGKVEGNSKTLQMTYSKVIYRSTEYEILILE